MRALAKLTGGKVPFCRSSTARLRPGREPNVEVHEFEGPHPAGTAGLHIHAIAPVSHHRTVWHIGLQDVLAIGHLVRTGELDVARIVALGGPAVTRPRLLRTRIGASVDDLARGELADGENRLISGSVLSGRAAMGEVHGYLGRFHQQVSVLAEDRERVFLGWLDPGIEVFRDLGYLSSLIPKKNSTLEPPRTAGSAPWCLLALRARDAFDPLPPSSFALIVDVSRPGRPDAWSWTRKILRFALKAPASTTTAQSPPKPHHHRKEGNQVVRL